ncbi:intradiol ring-cleavage dioxygenase [Streptomyces cynarae]|uniref:Intradiol ring-cleavage dioxygenase n=1 Tax=Streptomyces cynarae TaxID=2981134 RepID=A0ABY6DYZ4_9ACTN|nr:intradiol ring-cleavage dioxygenase [Streptomyces cynarae]UXY19640.1 intradiol ring-cleavage dioxygenase [Streptomyces cynarae]
MTDSDLTRRRALRLGGAAVGAVLGLGTGACSSSHRHAPDAHKAPGAELCVLNPSVTQGPYHLADAPFRRDVTEGKEGVPLTVRLTVRDEPHACALLKDAAVEIWQCDAWGYHSGFPAVHPGGTAPAESHASGTAPTTYLRGFQTTGADGVVEFVTIFPGWYTGRAPHLHVKVHTGGKKTAGTYKGGRVNWTGQLFFPDGDADAVYAKAPYTQHTGTRTRLAHDPVYRGGGARDGLMTVTGDAETGLVATLTVGIDPTRENTGAGGAPTSSLPSSASTDGTPPPDSAASASRTPTSALTPRSPGPSAPAVPRTP